MNWRPKCCQMFPWSAHHEVVTVLFCVGRHRLWLLKTTATLGELFWFRRLPLSVPCTWRHCRLLSGFAMIPSVTRACVSATLMSLTMTRYCGSPSTPIRVMQLAFKHTSLRGCTRHAVVRTRIGISRRVLSTFLTRQCHRSCSVQEQVSISVRTHQTGQSETLRRVVLIPIFKWVVARHCHWSMSKININNPTVQPVHSVEYLNAFPLVTSSKLVAITSVFWCPTFSEGGSGSLLVSGSPASTIALSTRSRHGSL